MTLASFHALERDKSTMPKILLIGESWFTYTVHQKGFDSFHNAEYTEGGGPFIEALTARGHDITYVPAHEVNARFPPTLVALRAFDLVVISDIGANSFQLSSETFTRSVPSPDKTELVRQYVAGGGALLMIGGYLSFSGIDGRARWGRVPLAAALPVDVLDRDDRVELPYGAEPRVVDAKHPVVAGLEQAWPAVLGLNEVRAKPGAEVLVECAGHPLLVVGEYEDGRTAAYTSDMAPHWAPPGFLEWSGYAELWDRLARWLSKGVV
jgi:uncharacterized membrane protein